MPILSQSMMVYFSNSPINSLKSSASWQLIIKVLTTQCLKGELLFFEVIKWCGNVHKDFHHGTNDT